MPDNIVVSKEKFNTLLQKLLQAEPIPYNELVKEPKLRKDGELKRSAVRKPDKT
jgi:hypothetical protein